MKHSRFSDSQIMGILKQAEQGIPLPQLCREHGMSRASFYKWRVKYGGMDASMISRLKRIGAGKPSPKKNVCRRTLESGGVAGSDGKKVVKLSERKEMAKTAVISKGISVQKACQWMGISETCYRYDKKLSKENQRIAAYLRCPPWKAKGRGG